jgi:hypothetical protein
MTGGLTVQSSTGQLRLQGTSNTNKNVSIFYNESGDYGQINVDESGVNQKDLWVTGLNLKFGRSTSSESMRIDSSGNVGIGGTPTSGGSGARWLTLDTPSTNTYSGGILYKINGTTKAYHYVENDHIMHQTTSGVGQKFYAGTSVAMTLNSSGNLIQGNNGTHSWTAINNTLFAAGGIGVTSNSDWGLQMAGSTTERIRFFTSSGGTGTVGNISVSTAGTTYTTTSDRRLKDNIQPIVDATDKLMDMKPVTHTWIDNSEAPQVHGFIAQEMQEVIPEAVSGDAESDEMMSMDYGRITPVIVAALQDALNEIKELKTRIDELENK